MEVRGKVDKEVFEEIMIMGMVLDILGCRVDVDDDIRKIEMGKGREDMMMDLWGRYMIDNWERVLVERDCGEMGGKGM